jgi:hypothetical protein
MRPEKYIGGIGLAVFFAACAHPGTDAAGADGGTGGAIERSSSTGGGGSIAVSASSVGGGATGGGEVGAGGAAPPLSCKVRDGEIDGEPRCDNQQMAHGLSLGLKWQYHPPPEVTDFSSVPLVAELDDDNGDGAIDLCDTPDVLVQAVYNDDYEHDVRLLILSGKDGSLERVIDPKVDGHPGFTIACPAIYDLDGDGVPEIIGTNAAGHVMVVEPDGTFLWEGSAEVFDPVGVYDPNAPLADRLRSDYVYESAVAVADIDGDGSPEILVGMSVLNADGSLRFQDATQGAEYGVPLGTFAYSMPIAADLDGSGTQSVIFGWVAYRADGSELYRLPLTTTPGYAQVADFFGAGDRQVLYQSNEGLTLISSEGEILWGPLGPHDGPPDAQGIPGVHAVSLADFDGDGLPEAIVSTELEVSVFKVTPSGLEALASVNTPADGQGHCGAASAAFPFAMKKMDWIANNSASFTVFDRLGPSSFGTSDTEDCANTDFPIVVDVDNDGSADILVRSNAGSAPTLLVFEDALHRSSPARRIWNQWNYVPTSVREDAKLPPAGVKPANSFRVQGTLSCGPTTGT